MKKSLLLYLLIIALIMNVFTFKYFSTKNEDTFKKTTKENEKLKDSIAFLYSTMNDPFVLKNNDRAQNYLYQYNIKDINAFESKVKEALLAYNDRPEGNKYTDQSTIGEQKFIINTIKILNHRWIVANYSNGSLWGEVLLKYFVNDDDSISFEVMNSYLYPLDLN